MTRAFIGTIAGAASLVFLVTLVPETALAWGTRAHHAICFTATRLVKNPKLREYLSSRGDLAGYLCNIPDLHWRNLSARENNLNAPTHYFHPEVVPHFVEGDLAGPYSKLLESYSGSREKAHTSIGSLPWRVDELVRKARASKSSLEKFTIMGTLGHFIGDASMPYHSAVDHDGEKSGHKGIHFFYETRVVDQFEMNWSEEVYKTALANPVKLNGPTLRERIWEFMKLFRNDLKEIERLDPKDRDPKKGAEVFYPLILKECAASASFLAQIWDENYQNPEGEWGFNLTPPFVELDYL